jgi:3-hydroxyisobutyrate dehydrogenase-like beta-hydroxyacid dehydrogenase
MGRHIALNLIKSEKQFVVCDVKDDAFAEFAALGAKTTTKVDDLKQCDLIFMCLPNTAAVKATLLAESGPREWLKRGQIIIDLSTINYTATKEIYDTLHTAGVNFMDAPMSGMEARAKDATLTIMCGGSRTIFDAVLPYLEKIGNNILFMGSSGNGQLTKLINQLLFNINAAALAEILPMAAKLGLDATSIGAVVNSGTGRSYASEFFIPRILERNFTYGYPMQAAYKDLVSAGEISLGFGIPLPVLAAATATYQQALLRGYGGNDKGSMIRVFEELLDVEFCRNTNLESTS